MADNKADFIDRMESTWKNWHGDEWSPEKATQNFQLYGPGKRAAALDQFDAELRDVEPTMENMRRYTELAELRQNLDTVHHTLKQVNR
jgi:hypothetical protein